MLRRKIDSFLIDWKNQKDKNPLIVRGARQIGKTKSIEKFAKDNYESLVEINFALQNDYCDIFNDGYEVDQILKNITYKKPSIKLIPGKTLIFFDEIQKCPTAATSLKSFKLDGRFDVICSGSLMGINYQEIESNAVGYKEDYDMKSMDFEEFLWAVGYTDDQIEEIYRDLVEVKALPSSIFNTLDKLFKDFIVVGGMPAIVKRFVTQKNFSGILKMQRQIIRDYEEDIMKYAKGLDKARVLNAFRKIPVFLSNENKKFFISKIEQGKKGREYVGAVDWLKQAGIINVSYCLEEPKLPLKGHYNPDNYRVYFMDTGLLIGMLDDEIQDDIRSGNNLNTCKGAIYENIAADMLSKAGHDLFFFKDEKGQLEMDFFVRDKEHLIPVEVKSEDSSTVSLNNLITKEKYADVKYGIKLAHKNIGFNGKFFTFPYFLTFMLKRFLKENIIK